VLHAEQSNRRTRSNTLGNQHDEDNGMSDGEGGDRYETPTRVRRNEESMQTSGDEEVNTPGSPRSVAGFPRASNSLLSEGGPWDGWTPSEVLAYRRAIGTVRRRLAGLVARLPEEEWDSGEWFETLDEIEAYTNTLETLRREFLRH